ncbi:hypothetical protein DFH09DRAFT_1320654 [Mycena vulgaris]|nr:hypothetical protein DFH09DRAFT_1320654 [Mycena vulgaris]
MQRRGRPETTQKDTHVRENSSVISRLPLPPAAAPTTPGPPGIVARARPPLAFPLLALAHGVAPHIHGPIGGAVSARRASIRTASDLLEASQPPSIRPPRSTSFQATPHSTTGSSASRPRPPAMRLAARVQSPRAHALQNRPAPHPPPTNPSSASDAPPQTEAAAAGDGRRRREDGCGGGKGAADEGEVEGESGVEASSRALRSTADELRGVGVELERALFGAGASPRARAVVGMLMHHPSSNGAPFKTPTPWMAGGALAVPAYQGTTRVLGQRARRLPPHRRLLLAARGTRSSTRPPARAHAHPPSISLLLLSNEHRVRDQCGSAASCSASRVRARVL